MNGFASNNLSCLVCRQKNSVFRIIDADLEFLKDASCEFRWLGVAGSDVVSRVACWARDARPFKCYSKSPSRGVSLNELKKILPRLFGVLQKLLLFGQSFGRRRVGQSMEQQFEKGGRKTSAFVLSRVCGADRI
jgi:hypothetical protein